LTATAELSTPESPLEQATPNGPTGAPLAGAAIAAIRLAATRDSQLDQPAQTRNVWQPDTWLIQQLWHALADAGEADAALRVADRAAVRDPLAPTQALYRLARHGAARPELTDRIVRELQRRQRHLLGPFEPADAPRRSEQLLLAAAATAAIGEISMACAYLERLDQIKGGWDRLFPNPELRTLLAETTARIGLHPLTAALIRASLRRFGEAGAHYLQQIADAVAAQLAHDDAPPAVARLLLRCVETIRYATLVTMHSHRVAIAILARAGLADEVMAHLSTVGRVQEARRESGLSLRKNDQSLLRQVKRPQADADVDFLVYTLQDAIRAMPVRQITREQRIELSQQLTTLGMRSDGWTAAGAAGTLIDLGALKFATEVVDNIAANDPTRSEGAIALVDGLLRTGEVERAAEESRKALDWAGSFEGDNAVRATVWGLAEVYLEHERPQEALDLLATRLSEPGFFARLRGLFQPQWDDDDLRDNRLRLAARLQQSAYGAEVDGLLRDLRQWAPRLLEGEALINFYTDGLVEPLLNAGRTDLVTGLLPEVGQALAASAGKHANHVERVATLLAARLDEGDFSARDMEAISAFLIDLWQADSSRGLWQTVYGVAGSLPLLRRLEGADALEDLAGVADNEGGQWSNQR
jgi:hypothetical protein